MSTLTSLVRMLTSLTAELRSLVRMLAKLYLFIAQKKLQEGVLF